MNKLEDRLEKCPLRLECISKVGKDCIKNYKECMVYGFYLKYGEKNEK